MNPADDPYSAADIKLIVLLKKQGKIHIRQD